VFPGFRCHNMNARSPSLIRSRGSGGLFLCSSSSQARRRGDDGLSGMFDESG